MPRDYRNCHKNILDITRIERGALELKKEQVRLDEIISDIIVDCMND
jgi:K+-sensing histidine kinase KdpD